MLTGIAPVEWPVLCWAFTTAGQFSVGSEAAPGLASIMSFHFLRREADGTDLRTPTYNLASAHYDQGRSEFRASSYGTQPKRRFRCEISYDARRDARREWLRESST